MPFENDKKIPRIHKDYDVVSSMQQLSYNSVFHFANHYANCLSNALVELMNPYLVSNLTGPVPSNLKNNATVLGQNNTAGNAALIFGNSNQIANTSILDAQNTIVSGNNNLVGLNTDNTFVFGFNNSLRDNSYNSLVLGKNNEIGVNGTGGLFNDNILVGNNSYNNGQNCILLGNVDAIDRNSQNCILIGVSCGISIYNTNPVSDCIAIGTQAYGEANNSVQLGTGINLTPTSLQFRSTTVANDTSIQARVQTSGVAPTSTPPDGTIVVDQTGNGTLWVRVNNTWKSTALV